jgi:hypothetical protein
MLALSLREEQYLIINSNALSSNMNQNNVTPQTRLQHLKITHSGGCFPGRTAKGRRFAKIGTATPISPPRKAGSCELKGLHCIHGLGQKLGIGRVKRLLPLMPLHAPNPSPFVQARSIKPPRLFSCSRLLNAN